MSKAARQIRQTSRLRAKRVPVDSSVKSIGKETNLRKLANRGDHTGAHR